MLIRKNMLEGWLHSHQDSVGQILRTFVMKLQLSQQEATNNLSLLSIFNSPLKGLLEEYRKNHSSLPPKLEGLLHITNADMELFPGL